MPRDREEESGFVVNDRRKFTVEGEVRPDAPSNAPAEEKTPVAVATAAPAVAEEAPAVDAEPEVPEPTAEEHAASEDAYHQSNTAFDRVIEKEIGAAGMGDLKMSFERLIGSMHMTGLMQLGLVYQRNAQPKVDILSARQTIDTLAILYEKTTGNVTENEEAMMRNSLYELRMAYLEVGDALARQAQAGPKGVVGV